MTKKDFEMIANVFRIERANTTSGEARRAIEDTARAMAAELSRTNPRFRYDTFYAACGM